MSETIRLAIAGYGNLGKGLEAAVSQNPDMELVAIFTRRDPMSITAQGNNVAVHRLDQAPELADSIDVMVACGGSKEDLPVQVPELARHFNVVDSFDTHAKIPEYFATVDSVASAAGTLALISTGWDPGLFSLNRLFAEAILPVGQTSTFWGRGVSQGHSDAIRRVAGVAAGVQYTIPRPEALEAARSGSSEVLTAGQSHLRQCFVVLEEGADAEVVRETIVTMPDYFVGYETTVEFISADELASNHSTMPHGGTVIRRGTTPDGSAHTIEYRLELDENPAFTASVLVAYARATHRLAVAGETGARTVFDVAPGLLSPNGPDELRKSML